MVPNYKTLTPQNDYEAARFLAHATLGYTRADIAEVTRDGYYTWINNQFALSTTPTHWNWVKNKRDTTNEDNRPKRYHAVDSIWRKFLGGKDLLRQKTVFALSQIIVTSIEADIAPWQQVAAAHYMDILDQGAFGTYADLLKKISLSPMMGYYLSFIGSKAAGRAGTNSMPDENYARELLQLFSIGLVKLEQNGELEGGVEQPTYDQEDILNLARVFTGWTVAAGADLRTYGNQDLINPVWDDFDSKAKDLGFINVQILENETAMANLDKVIQGLNDKQNIRPFIARQLIQRFTTSNPSPEYIGRVSLAYRNNKNAPPRDGIVTGVKGDMRALLIAILLDDDLFVGDRRTGTGEVGTPFGKLREPVHRFVQLGKVFDVKSRSKAWWIDKNEDELGQKPMGSPSVFNFYRPGYVPPGTDMAELGLVAPEFQITHETSVIRYINFMQRAIDKGIGTHPDDNKPDIVFDFSTWTQVAPISMVEEFNVLLAAGQLSEFVKGKIVGVLDGMPVGNNDQRLDRVKVAAMMVVCAPDFLALK